MSIHDDQGSIHKYMPDWQVHVQESKGTRKLETWFTNLLRTPESGDSVTAGVRCAARRIALAGQRLREAGGQCEENPRFLTPRLGDGDCSSRLAATQQLRKSSSLGRPNLLLSLVFYFNCFKKIDNGNRFQPFALSYIQQSCKSTNYYQKIKNMCLESQTTQAVSNKDL